jgi:Leucine-rich repeat (LRR) protein
VLIGFVSQALDISFNNLHSLPDEMSGLQNLKELNLSWNNLPAPPVVLGRLTALTKIDMANQRWSLDQSDTFKVPSPLLPILHPGLVHLDLQQQAYDYAIRGPRLRPWDELSLSHLEQALAEVVDRRPVPTLLF